MLRQLLDGWRKGEMSVPVPSKGCPKRGSLLVTAPIKAKSSKLPSKREGNRFVPIGSVRTTQTPSGKLPCLEHLCGQPRTHQTTLPRTATISTSLPNPAFPFENWRFPWTLTWNPKAGVLQIQKEFLNMHGFARYLSICRSAEGNVAAAVL